MESIEAAAGFSSSLLGSGFSRVERFLSDSLESVVSFAEPPFSFPGLSLVRSCPSGTTGIVLGLSYSVRVSPAPSATFSQNGISRTCSSPSELDLSVSGDK